MLIELIVTAFVALAIGWGSNEAMDIFFDRQEEEEVAEEYYTPHFSQAPPSQPNVTISKDTPTGQIAGLIGLLSANLLGGALAGRKGIRMRRENQWLANQLAKVQTSEKCGPLVEICDEISFAQSKDYEANVGKDIRKLAQAATRRVKKNA